MKRSIRKYLSAILLLCLFIQLAPLSLLHSHENHLTEVGHKINTIHDTDAHHDECSVDKTHDESSENECNVCKIQQSLNNQAYSISQQADALHFANQLNLLHVAKTAVDDYLIKITSGRAPPLS